MVIQNMMQDMHDIKMVNAQQAKIVSIKTHLYKECMNEKLWQCIISLLFPVSETLQNT
jgi:hypothetical protein